MSSEAEALAVAAHGGSAILNALGFVFNWRRKNWFDVGVHGAGFVYHAVAVFRHVGVIYSSGEK